MPNGQGHGLIWNVLALKYPAFIIPENNSKEPLKAFHVRPMDNLINKLKMESPEAESYELHYPESDEGSHRRFTCLYGGSFTMDPDKID
ncbi:hypothetical protein [Maribacter polysaccharolyticus]|uniref:hypothetical protein n=1 Tax=Maribacter polysaccharolyticus TaxID=3020831 RepID=UPI00237F3306|nr:hypothetical protein [Maribacter polysaccharolyticus]MDE3741283.1 hypothetical protein [Maribacter polysaccharolyticus]